MNKRFWALLLAALLLTGCVGKKSAPSNTVVVSRITVDYLQEEQTVEKVFVTQYKMRQILNHFRTLGQKYSPIIDPDTLTGQAFRVRVFFSDGSERLYRTKSDRYIRTNDGPWQQTDPQKLQQLNFLLLSLPADIV